MLGVRFNDPFFSSFTQSAINGKEKKNKYGQKEQKNTGANYKLHSI